MSDSAPAGFVILRRILSAIEEIGKALRNQNDVISEVAQSANRPVPVEVTLSQSVETRKSTNDARDDRSYQRLTLLVSVLTFCAVSIYAVLVYFQLREMIGATGATQDAVHEARLSRQQAQKSLQSTVDQFGLDQRAWIGPADGPVIDWGVGKVFSVTLPVRDTGKTPGINLTTVAVLRGLAKNKQPTFTDFKQTIGHGVLQPSATTYIIVASESPVPQTQFDAVKSGDLVVWVYGRITYNDVFGRPHWTTFAQIYNPTKNGLDTFQTHNEVDRENLNTTNQN